MWPEENTNGLSGDTAIPVEAFDLWLTFINSNSLLVLMIILCHNFSRKKGQSFTVQNDAMMMIKSFLLSNAFRRTILPFLGNIRALQF